jgi:hypothetical protein
MVTNGTKSKVEAKSNIMLDRPNASLATAKKYTFKPKINRIGFHRDVDKNATICTKSKVENLDYTDEDVDNYRKVMYATQTKSGNAKGFRQIGTKVGISPKVAEKIHGYLCTTGEVEVVGGRTRINREVV